MKYTLWVGDRENPDLEATGTIEELAAALENHWGDSVGELVCTIKCHDLELDLELKDTIEEVVSEFTFNVTAPLPLETFLNLVTHMANNSNPFEDTEAGET